jgi:hypothetical protein
MWLNKQHEKVTTCRLRFENGFFGTKVVHLAVAGTLTLSGNCMYVRTPLCTSKKKVKFLFPKDFFTIFGMCTPLAKNTPPIQCWGTFDFKKN